MEFWEIAYSDKNTLQTHCVKILANDYNHAKKQFEEMNRQFGNIMCFINAYEILKSK